MNKGCAEFSIYLPPLTVDRKNPFMGGLETLHMK